jgi:hypothetical protein
MNDNRIVRSLNEDFAQIGFAGTARDLNRMSSQRLEESLYSVPAVNADSDRFDPIDGPVVTMELFNRIADLDFNSLSEDDCDDLLSGLSDKELPSGDSDLAEAAEAVVKAIVEARIARRRAAGSRRMIRTTRTTSTEKMKSKKYRRSAGGKRAVRVKARKQAAGKLTAKQKASARVTGIGRSGLVAAAKGRLGRGPQAIAADAVSDGLAVELESMLGEQVSNQFGEYGETVSRIARVLSLIEEILGEEVGDVLESAYEKMENSLLTESVNPSAAFGPTIKVISRCLAEIDQMGND